MRRLRKYDDEFETEDLLEFLWKGERYFRPVLPWTLRWLMPLFEPFENDNGEKEDGPRLRSFMANKSRIDDNLTLEGRSSD